MRINQGDYVICSQAQGKDYLVKALADTKGDLEAVCERLCHIPSQRQTLTVSSKDLVLNLGPKPKAGKVWGIDLTNLYYTKKVHDTFGSMFFFYKPDKEVVRNLWAGLDKAYKILDKLGLAFVLERDITWEILPAAKTEKYAGMYIRRVKGENVIERIQIKPESVTSAELPYVILHELAHCIDANYVTSRKLKALWLRLFTTSIKVATVQKSMSAELLNMLMDQPNVPSDFKSSLDEEQTVAFKCIMRTIQSVNALSIKELDVLFDAQMFDDIKAVWPLRTIPRKDIAPIVSDYATKNVRELFAESFSHHYTKRTKIPEAVVKLLERTISYAKTQKVED